MESVMANQIDEKQWYLAVGERSLGPISTDLVARGIRSGKVPVTAWVCQVGDNSWSALSSFNEFQEAVEGFLATTGAANVESSGENPSDASVQEPVDNEVRSGEASSPEGTSASSEDEDEATGQRSLLPYERTEPTVSERPGFTAEPQVAAAGVFSSVFGEDEPGRGEENSYSDISGQREVDPEIRREAAVATNSALGAEHSLEVTASLPTSAESTQASDDELGIDITFDEDEHGSIDWKERFQSYFLVGTEIQLPEETKLLQSLDETPKSTFLHDEALWNLALCLAFGSDVVAEASAYKFYDALEFERELHRAPERVEWICRTLLSKGFMPSGIPRMEGNRGVDMLRRACPNSLREILEREASG